MNTAASGNNAAAIPSTCWRAWWPRRAPPTAWTHGSHERLHRLGQQRHAGHGGSQLRPQDGGGPALPRHRSKDHAAEVDTKLANAFVGVVTAAGLRACKSSKADASSLTAYTLQSAVDTYSEVRLRGVCWRDVLHGCVLTALRPKVPGGARPPSAGSRCPGAVAPPAHPAPCRVRSAPSFLNIRGQDLGRTTRTTLEAGRRCRPGRSAGSACASGARHGPGAYALLSHANEHDPDLHLGLRPPSRDFDYNQPLIREGPHNSGP